MEINNQPAVKPDNNLVWAILSTVLCCWPVGAYAIYLATKVDTFWANGQYDEAIQAADKAKKFSIYAAIAGVALCVICIVIEVIVFVVAAALD